MLAAHVCARMRGRVLPVAALAVRSDLRVAAVPHRSLCVASHQWSLGQPSYPSKWMRSFSSVPNAKPNQDPPNLYNNKDTKLLSVVRLKKGLNWSAEKSVYLLRGISRLSKKTIQLLFAFIRDPKVVRIWAADLKEAVNHMLRWMSTGFRLFGANVRISSKLASRSVQGHPLTLRERKLLIRTTSDLFKLVPFSLFIIIPFAELLLPVFLRIFPNMLPSTFFESTYDNATLSRKLKAKQELASFFQDVVARRTKESLQEEDNLEIDRKKELVAFQEKLQEGSEFPSAKELLRFSKMFKQDFRFTKMDSDTLVAMCRMLGLPILPLHSQLVLQLRHHVTGLRREDRELLWEGLDNLSDKKELVDYCKARAIRFDVSKDKMRQYLGYWLEISSHKDIDISLLLWCQTFFICSDEYKIALTVNSNKLAPDVEETPETLQEQSVEAAQAFSKMKERRQTRLAEAEEQLLELKMELATMTEHQPADKTAEFEQVTTYSKIGVTDVCDAAAVDTIDEDLHNYSALEVTRLGKTALFEEISLLEEQRDNALTVVEKQHRLLKKQLEFLSHMRKNEPTINKDPDTILLDQRARLVEMFNQFNTDFNLVEDELEKLTARSIAGRDKLVQASVKRLENRADQSDGSATDDARNFSTQKRHEMNA